MKLTVLGMYGPYPAAGGACSSYLLEASGKKILLDMGSGSLANLQKVCKLDDIDIIILSHLHFDHTSDILPLHYYTFKNRKKLTVFAPPAKTEAEKALLDCEGFEYIVIDESLELFLGDTKVNFFKMTHPVECYASRFEARDGVFVYTGDTTKNDNLQKACEGADLILADCSQKPDFTGPHMTVTDGIELAQKTGARLIMTHQNGSYNPADDIKSYKNICTAELFKTYDTEEK